MCCDLLNCGAKNQQSFSSNWTQVCSSAIHCALGRAINRLLRTSGFAIIITVGRCELCCDLLNCGAKNQQSFSSNWTQVCSSAIHCALGRAINRLLRTSGFAIIITVGRYELCCDLLNCGAKNQQSFSSNWTQVCSSAIHCALGRAINRLLRTSGFAIIITVGRYELCCDLLNWGTKNQQSFSSNWTQVCSSAIHCALGRAINRLLRTGYRSFGGGINCGTTN